MKWYRHRCPFCGRGSIVSVITILVVVMFGTMMPEMPVIAVIGMILGAGFVILLSYLILNMLSEEERTLVELSEPLEWYNMDDDLVERVRKKKKVSWHEFVIFLIIAIAIAFAIADGLMFQRMDVPVMVFADIMLCWVIFFVYYRNKWGRLDRSAEYACPVVDHVKSITERTKHGKRTYNYAVFYLPDGRYMLKVDSKSATWKLYLIRFNGYYTYACLSE